MDVDAVWRAIDAERAGVADLLDDLTPSDWETPSLCAGWRVRDVAAHLTLAETGVRTAVVDLIRARGSFDQMVHDTAVRRAALPTAEFAPRLRAMAGSRRTAPLLTPLEPLLDVLIHGQDIARPLGRSRPMPLAATTASATRVWQLGRPFFARRRLRGIRLTATDADWSRGDGPLVEGPISALLLLLSGRSAALPELGGEGLAELTARQGVGDRRR
jgi:uncharacterized protein (TIGR03083 family)